MNTSTAPLSPLEVKVQLDVERTICYKRSAEYKMQTLPRPFLIRNLVDDTGKGFGALVAWLWASLVEKDARDFPTPESLSDLVTPERVPALCAAFYKTYSAVQEKTDDKEDPKAGSSTNGPSAL